MEKLRDNLQRRKDIVSAFIVLAFTGVVSIFFALYQNGVLREFDAGNVTVEEIDTLDTLSSIISIAQTIANIVVIVLFIKWFRRAYGNLIRIGVPMEFSESGAVWGYFIPIVSLFRPVTTMKETYTKTQQAIRKQNSSFFVDRDTSLITFWWIVYIIGNIITNMASRIYLNADSISQFIEGNNYYIFSDTFDLLSIGLAILVITKVSKLETTLKNTYKSRSIIDEIGVVPTDD